MNGSPSARIDLLREHRVLPPDSDTQALTRVLDCGGNLLGPLHEAWSQAGRTPKASRQRRRAGRRAAWLALQLRQHAALTCGFPGAARDVFSSWVGERLIWWPRGVPAGRRTSIISSRLGRPLEKHAQWFHLLRCLCQSLDPDHEIVISAADTAAAPFLERCRELFRVRVLEFVPPRHSTTTLQQWLDECARTQPSAISPLSWPAYVSPILAPEPNDPSPLRDRLAVAAADRIVAIRARAGGNIEHLLRKRLIERSADTPPCVLLAIGADLVPPSLAEALQLMGAAPLHLDGICTKNPRLLRPDLPQSPRAEMRPGAGTVLTLDQLDTADYLTHCTRHATGPWPDQSMEDYRDALILARPDTDHSALATLRRIVDQQRLLASGKAIRGGCGVVCFTAVDVKEISRLRTFRAHRGRWDFAPYGICIRKSWLKRHATRRVRYGDPALWTGLNESQRPYYQRRCAGRRNQLDWTLEREWRHLGALDLIDLPATDAFLFVPTKEEAERLAVVSRWPVAVLP